MKSFRSYLTILDPSKQSPDNLGICQPTQHQKLVRTLFATTLVASSQFLAVLSASSNPVPTPSQPSPVVPTRTIFNGNFEQPRVGGNYVGVLEGYGNSGAPIIWQTTEAGSPTQRNYINKLEVWNGIEGGASPRTNLPAGNQFVELNADTNGSLYQDVCVLRGETVTWSLRHAVRRDPRSSASIDYENKMQVSITDPTIWANSKTPPAIKLYTSSTLATLSSQGWRAKSESWTNPVTNNVQKLRFAFEAIKGSPLGGVEDKSVGNFIDDVTLNFSPLIDFLPTNGGNVNLATTTEGNPTSGNPPYYYLSLRINGVTTTASTVKINLTGLNAPRQFTLGSILKGNAVATGLSATKFGNEITLTIPAGSYDANVVSNYIHIPINFGDTNRQPNDNLLFTLTTVTGGGTSSTTNLAVGSTNCASGDRRTVETLLIDDDYVERVQLPLPLTVAAQRSK